MTPAPFQRRLRGKQPLLLVGKGKGAIGTGSQVRMTAAKVMGGTGGRKQPVKVEETVDLDTTGVTERTKQPAMLDGALAAQVTQVIGKSRNSQLAAMRTRSVS